MPPFELISLKIPTICIATLDTLDTLVAARTACHFLLHMGLELKTINQQPAESPLIHMLPLEGSKMEV